MKHGLDLPIAGTQSPDAMSDEARPKPLFFVVLAIVILGLVAYGFRSVIFPKSESRHPVSISKDELSDAKGVEARYVRLFSNGSDKAETNHYVEVEVYGKPK